MFRLRMLLLGALAGGAMLANGLDAGLTAVAAPRRHTNEAQSVCAVVDSSGRTVVNAFQSASERGLADALQAIADANTDDISGVALCTNYVGAQVFVASPSSSVMASIQTVADRYPTLPVSLVAVPNGLNALRAAEQRIGKRYGSSVSTVFPDPSTGGLKITTPASAGPVSTATQEGITAAATDNGAVKIPVTITATAGALSNDSGPNRIQDTQPYSMSDNIYAPGVANSNCSAGVPIIIGGVRRVLTAGHCAGSTYDNNAKLFGTTYTTSYPGNASLYGDWKLLQGQTYIANAYTSTNTSSTKANITGAVWGARPRYSQICTDGAATTQICRYFIYGTDGCATLGDGIYTCQQIEVYHDSTGTGNYYDSAGATGGDSGGPAYFSDGAGGLVVAGIVKGGGPIGGVPYWFFTQLSGVRAWNSSATVG